MGNQVPVLPARPRYEDVRRVLPEMSEREFLATDDLLEDEDDDEAEDEKQHASSGGARFTSREKLMLYLSSRQGDKDTSWRGRDHWLACQVDAAIGRALEAVEVHYNLSGPRGRGLGLEARGRSTLASGAASTGGDWAPRKDNCHVGGVVAGPASAAVRGLAASRSGGTTTGISKQRPGEAKTKTSSFSARRIHPLHNRVPEVQAGSCATTTASRHRIDPPQQTAVRSRPASSAGVSRLREEMKKEDSCHGATAGVVLTEEQDESESLALVSAFRRLCDGPTQSTKFRRYDGHDLWKKEEQSYTVPFNNILQDVPSPSRSSPNRSRSKQNRAAALTNTAKTSADEYAREWLRTSVHGDASVNADLIRVLQAYSCGTTSAQLSGTSKTPVKKCVKSSAKCISTTAYSRPPSRPVPAKIYSSTSSSEKGKKGAPLSPLPSSTAVGPGPGSTQFLRPGERVYFQRESFFWPAVVEELVVHNDDAAACVRSDENTDSSASIKHVLDGSQAVRITLSYLQSAFWHPRVSETLHVKLVQRSPEFASCSGAFNSSSHFSSTVIEEIDRICANYNALKIIDELKQKGSGSRTSTSSISGGCSRASGAAPPVVGATGTANFLMSVLESATFTSETMTTGTTGTSGMHSNTNTNDSSLRRSRDFFESVEQLELNRFFSFAKTCSIMWYLFPTSRLMTNLSNYLKEYEKFVRTHELRPRYEDLTHYHDGARAPKSEQQQQQKQGRPSGATDYTSLEVDEKEYPNFAVDPTVYAEELKHAILHCKTSRTDRRPEWLGSGRLTYCTITKNHNKDQAEEATERLGVADDKNSCKETGMARKENRKMGEQLK